MDLPTSKALHTAPDQSKSISFSRVVKELHFNLSTMFAFLYKLQD
jgi:hypothetical protein